MTAASRSSSAISRHKFLKAFFGSVSLLILCAAKVMAQGGTGSTPLAMSPGTPAGSYALSDVDSVNLYNGRVNVHIPLLNVSGRGSAGGPVSMNVNSPATWNVQYFDDDGYIHYGVSEAEFPIGDGLHYGMYEVRAVGSGIGGPNPCGQSDPGIWAITLTRLSVVDPEGTEHEMRDLAHGGQPYINQSQCPGYGNTGPSRGRVFVTTDGSGVTYVADDVIRDGVQVGNEMPTGGGQGGWLLLRDGRRYRIGTVTTLRDPFDSWGIGAVRDRNGNIAGETQDSLYRRVTQVQGTAAQCAALGEGATDSCFSLSYKGFGGASREVWVSAYFWRPYVIVLPNNLRYRFYYNQYNDLIRLDLPTGGSIEYDYEAGLGGPQPSYPQGFVNNPIPGYYASYIYRRVTERRVYKEGHVLENRQTFSKPEYTYNFNNSFDYQVGNVGFVEKKLFDSNNNLKGSEKHYFYGSANSSFSIDVMSFAAWRDGREYRSEVYDENGTLLRQVDQTWEQRAPVSWWAGDQNAAPANDPRIAETTTRLENGLASRTAYAYDATVPYNSPTDIYQYGFDGQLLRHTKTTFLKNQNGVDYTGSNLYTDPNPQANSTPYLRDLPLQVSVFDGSEVERARTTYEYDNYTPDAGSKHAALINYTDISGLCTWYDSSNQCTNINPSDSSDPSGYKTRGNVTAVFKWLLDNGGTPVGSPLTSYMQYDVAGNVTRTIDEHGNVTQLAYGDRFGSPDDEARSNTPPSEWLTSGQGYAYPTTAVNALGFTSYTQFDYYTGKVVNEENVNGTVTSVSYVDPLDRPTVVVVAANVASLRHHATFEYDDVQRVVKAYTDRDADNDRTFHRESVYDGLGRITQTRVYDDANAPNQYILTTTIYDSFGRVTQVSNPYRPTLNEAAVFSTTEYDALGRATKLTAPGSRPLVTEYTGNTVTVTDQAGNKRSSSTDALGRMVQVVEDPGGFGFVTDYTYDVLGNMRKVRQSSQQGFQERYFSYDSLSRLVRTSNPEQEINTNLPALTDAVTNRSQWSTAHSYDVVNSTDTTTDARGVVTTVNYDQIGRVKTVSYTNDPSNTPQVTYTYDAAAVPNSKGRLTSVANSISVYNYTGYDALGRVTASSQATANQTAYTMSYGYDLAGDLTSETYPSGRVVTTGYDTAGRIASVDGQKAGQTTHYLSAIKYWPSGALQEAHLGNGLVEHGLLNDRLQPKEIALGTSSTDSSVLKLEYTYGVLDGAGVLDTTKNNGSLQSQKITVPGLAPLTQTYGYDSLDRLLVAKENGGTSWKQTFTYDQYGNRSVDADNTTTDAVGDNPQLSATTNRITPRQGEQYRYDKTGNLDRDKLGSTFTYDANDRVTAFNGGASAGTTGTNYYFDGLGQRVKKADYYNTSLFVHDAFGKMVAEYSNATPEAGGTSYLTADTLGTARVITGTNGTSATVKARHDYLPFGEEIGGAQVNLKGGRSSTQMYLADNLRQKFTGKERDSESGLDYFLARDYSGSQGRFTSVDPLMSSAHPTEPQSWNRYAYSANNPLKFADPSGMSYFVGGSGAADPFITEYRVDGFDQSPDGTMSNLDREEMGGLAQQTEDMDPPPPSFGTVDDQGNMITVSATGIATITSPQGDVAQTTMVIIWADNAAEVAVEVAVTHTTPDNAGHVSYIFMQTDRSLSWEGVKDWTENTPSSEYTTERSKSSAGMGYLLDFHDPKINAKFQNALYHAYDRGVIGRAIMGTSKRTYDPIVDNCGQAFNVAINAIHKDIGVPTSHNVRPSAIEGYIKQYLMPKNYVTGMQKFPKH